MREILNEEMLEELKDIMEEDFASLLQTFLVESKKQFCEAKDAWQAQDYEVLRRAVHSLKGSCGNIGAETLQSTCAELEYKTKENVLAVVPDLLDSAESQLAEVQAVVKKFI